VNRKLLVTKQLVAVVALACAVLLLPCASGRAQTAPASIGFGVSVPYSWPISWAESYSFVTLEMLVSPNLTVLTDLGTYPSAFPDLFEGGASLLAKAWIGPTALFAGGGLSLQARSVGTAWSFKPYLVLRAGYQVWLHESFAVILQFRTLEPLPVTWTLAPEVSIGFAMGLGSARSQSPRYDGDALWVLLGLGVAALVAFLPRK
jgi:hypothetical protein